MFFNVKNKVSQTIPLILTNGVSINLINRNSINIDEKNITKQMKNLEKMGILLITRTK